MKVLVVTATQAEVPLILQSDNRYSNLFDVLVTGVGMVATALSLGQALSQRSYAAILNLGVAGSFRKDIDLGEVVRIQKDVLSELGAEDGMAFCPIEVLGFGGSIFSERPFAEDVNCLSTLRKVNGITVNTVHGHEQTIQTIQNRLNPDVESMEGAAVFYAAQTFHLPCLQIRSISNFVEKRNKEKWQVEKALNYLNEWFNQFIKNDIVIVS